MLKPKDMKTLSIIVPTYNMEKYLDKCLSSLIINDSNLLKQLEVLVIIDGATDRSSEIAHSYQTRYPEVFVVVDKENGNYGSCINRGVKEATGKYIRVLDADDWYNTANLELFLRKIEKVNVDKIATIYSAIHMNKRTTIVQPYPAETVMEMKDVKHGNYIPMHAVTYRTQLLRDMNYVQTEGMSYTDFEWMHLPTPYVKTLYYVPLDIYQYFVGREGQTVDPDVVKKSYPQMFYLLRKILEEYSKSIKIAPNQEYVINNVTNSICWIYTEAFIPAKFQGDNECVLAMDNYLKTYYTSIYEHLDEIFCSRLFHYRFVHEWRKKGSPLNISRWHIRIYELTHLHIGFKNFYKNVMHIGKH